MKVKKWNWLVGCGLLASVIFVIGFNYIVDPYEIFQTKYFRPGPAINDRFAKVEHLLKNKGRYDSLIVGASTMGMYEPEWLVDVRPGQSFYNASFMSGLPADVLKLLKSLKAEGMSIREIYMGIDLFPFMQIDETRSQSKKNHFIMVGQPAVAFYANYMFASSLFHGLAKINDSANPVQSLRFEIDNGGTYHLDDQDKQMANDKDAYAKRWFKNRDTPESELSSVVWVKSRFDEFQELINWTKANGIKYTIFIHPTHRLLRDTLPKKDMDDFRMKISEIAGKVPDFSDRKDITDNDFLYYDPKHYVPSVAKQLISEIN